MGERVEEEQLRDLIAEVDINKNGTIEFDEFLQVRLGILEPIQFFIKSPFLYKILFFSAADELPQNGRHSQQPTRSHNQEFRAENPR